MQLWVAALVVIVAVASRPIETRLWLAGRLSDRTLAALLVGRLPVLVLVFAILADTAPALVVVLTLIALIPAFLMYRLVLGIVRQHASEDPRRYDALPRDA